MRTFWLFTLLLALLIAPLGAQGISGTTAGPSGISGGIDVTRPGTPETGNMSVDLQLGRTQYTVGDSISMQVRTSDDAYVFVYSTNQEGETRQLLPNGLDSDNFVNARQTLRLPSSLYNLKATSPGRQTINVFAVSAVDNSWRPPADCYPRSANDAFPILRAPIGRVQSDVLRSAQERSDRNARAQQATAQGAGDKLSGTIQETRPGYSKPARRPLTGEAQATLYIRDDPYRDSPTRRPPDAGRIRPSGNEKGTLSLTSSPSPAEVYVDSYYYGLTPIQIDLPPGRFRTQVKRNGFTTWERQVEIDRNKTSRYAVRLNKKN